MRTPTRSKEVQSLRRWIAILIHFVSKSTNQWKPFFDVLRGEKKFEWTFECQIAFDELKKQLAQPPIISKPKMGETLILYAVVSEHAISAVLAREEKRIKHRVYYTSKAFHEVELRYSSLEKLSYVVIMVARKLQKHLIKVLNNCHLV